MTPGLRVLVFKSSDVEGGDASFSGLDLVSSGSRSLSRSARGLSGSTAEVMIIRNQNIQFIKYCFQNS